MDSRKIGHQFSEYQGFFGLGGKELEIEFLKDNNPFRIYSPKNMT
jgi:hypothetical protein